jgi:hypothetical protein
MLPAHCKQLYLNRTSLFSSSFSPHLFSCLHIYFPSVVLFLLFLLFFSFLSSPNGIDGLLVDLHGGGHGVRDSLADAATETFAGRRSAGRGAQAIKAIGEDPDLSPNASLGRFLNSGSKGRVGWWRMMVRLFVWFCILLKHAHFGSHFCSWMCTVLIAASSHIRFGQFLFKASL